MIYYLKKSQKSGKESPEPRLILGKIYNAQFNDGRFVYSTGERILWSKWVQPKRQKGERAAPTGRPKKDEALQIRLNKIATAALNYIRDNRESLTKEGLKAHLDALRPREKKKEAMPAGNTLVGLWSEYLASIKDTVEWRTFNSYSNSFETSSQRCEDTVNGTKKKRKGTNFREFLKLRKWEDITPDQFTATHYNLYNGYLKTNVKPNTAAKRLKHLKQFLSHLVNDLKLPVGFDLNKIAYKETAGLKLSLSKDELQAYIEAELPEHLVKVRDLAVIQCATGLRISDRQRIDKNIKGNKIVIEAQKTRSRMEIPITPQIREVLEKYNYELPELSEQNYRAGIKEIHRKLFPDQKVQVREGNGYKDVHVWEEISSHDMVRTFISLSAEKGMPIPAIATITGKSVATLLKNYLVVSQKFAEEEMEKAWGASPLKVAR
jgi:site-specific recombinase XerD